MKFNLVIMEKISRYSLEKHLERNRQSKGKNADQHFIELKPMVGTALKEDGRGNMEESSSNHPINNPQGASPNKILFIQKWTQQHAQWGGKRKNDQQNKHPSLLKASRQNRH